MDFFQLENSELYRKYFLKNCRLLLSIGIYPEEKKAPQEVVLNIEALVLRHRDFSTDELLPEDFNYDFLMETVKSVAEKGHIHLQETLVDSIAHKLMEHPSISALRVRSEKTQAYPSCESAGIECCFYKNK